MPEPIKKNAEGYQINGRLFEWALIMILGAGTAGGVGIYGLGDKGSNQSVMLQTVEEPLETKPAHIKLKDRMREAETRLNELGGPHDPLMPKVEKLEDKIDAVQTTVNENKVLLRELVIRGRGLAGMAR